MNLSISRLTRNEIDRARASCDLFWDMPPTNEALAAFLADPANLLLTAEVDGRPAGQLLGYILQRWDNLRPMAFLYSIDVIEAFQRRGIGRQLVEGFLDEGRKAGCSEAFVITNRSNEAAKALYETVGGKMAEGDELMYEWNL